MIIQEGGIERLLYSPAALSDSEDPNLSDFQRTHKMRQHMASPILTPTGNASQSFVIPKFDKKL